MSERRAGAAEEILARLDRIPVWPHPRSLVIVIGAGYFFAFFDIITIAYALPVLTKQLDISAGAASWSITSGLVGYIAGSLLDSRIADRFGRRLSLFLSVSLFTVGSLLTATSTNLGWLLLWRFVSGMGIGAEIALATTYMAEMSPAPLRGRSTGWTLVAAFLGLAAVPFVATALVPSYAWGWRALFVIGGLGGLAMAFMRRRLPDSPHWLAVRGRVDEAEVIVVAAEERARKRLGGELPPVAASEPAPGGSDSGSLRELLRAPYAGRLLLLACVWFVYYIGNYAWLTLAPELLSKQGVPLRSGYFDLAITGGGFVAGALAAVRLNDRGERRTIVSCAALVWAAALAVIGWLPSDWTIRVVGFVAAFTIGVVIPVLYTYTGENFPTRVRATGIAISDGVGHLGGAFCGQIVLPIYAAFGFAGAFTSMAVTGVAVAGLVLLGTRTTGRSLGEIAP